MKLGSSLKEWRDTWIENLGREGEQMKQAYDYGVQKSRAHM